MRLCTHWLTLCASYGAQGLLKWKVRTGSYGSIVGSPAVDLDGVVYIRDNDYPFFYAINPNGTVKWKFSTTCTRACNCECGAANQCGAACSQCTCSGCSRTPSSASPTVYGSHVYFGWDSNTLYALNTVNGSVHWKYTTEAYIEHGQPFVANDMVYIGSHDHYLYALNRADGRLMWKYDAGSGIRSSPVEVDGIVYVGSDDGTLHAVNT
jgi:eukaryotic-like serine/threonine-protein kinase